MLQAPLPRRFDRLDAGQEELSRMGLGARDHISCPSAVAYAIALWAGIANHDGLSGG